MREWILLSSLLLAAPAGAEEPAAKSAGSLDEVLKQIGQIVDAAETRADGRVCATALDAAKCDLVYTTTCAREGGVKYGYTITVPLKKLDPKTLQSGLGLSGHPSHYGVKFGTAGPHIEAKVDGQPQPESGVAVLGIGVGEAAEKAAKRLADLLRQAHAQCAGQP